MVVNFKCCDGDGNITYEEFIQGILRLKGQARSLDVVAVGRSCDKMNAKLETIIERLEQKAKMGKASLVPSIATSIRHGSSK
jgi:hypothetical protein